MTLPKFQEPDWSQLPKEAVAWAVDENGCAYTYDRVPVCDSRYSWFMSGKVTGAHGVFDLTNIDWRTTLRLRPGVESKWTGAKTDTRPQRGSWAPGNYLCKCNGCHADYFGDKRSVVCADCSYGMPESKSDLQAAQESPEFKAQIEALAESVDDLKESQRNYELERLAEDFMKALLGNPNSGGATGEEVAREAFDFAECFTLEREKRRSQCP